MKKFLSLIIAVIFAHSLNAQVTEASDFIATDYFGNEIHLYEILEGGQYVLMHINTRTNAATPKVTPPLVEAYKRLGCNQHDVFFIGVVPNGTTNITKKYVDEYGIEFPMIHNTDESNGMQGPAMNIWQTYQCEQPATMLIAPNKSIVFDDINTIETSDDIVSALAEYDIQEYECGEEPEEVGTSVIDLQAEVLSETSVRIIATPNAETVVYHYILITKADADEMGHEETMQLLYEDEFPLTEVDDWTWQGLAPGTTYYAIAQGKNKNEEWGEITKIEFTTTGDGLVESANNTFKVYPNPASDYINITSEIRGEAEVNIYDMTGRCVKNTRINDMSNATINISDVEEGIYFVNINGKVMKLIVE